jgi:hypothetical protein
MLTHGGSETNLWLGAKVSQVTNIVGERITVLALQRVVLDDVFQIADEAVQLAFVEFSFAQVPIEVRSLPLRISIPLDLLFVSLDFLDVSMVPEIRGPFEVTLHTGYQVARSGIWDILGRAQRSR